MYSEDYFSGLRRAAELICPLCAQKPVVLRGTNVGTWVHQGPYAVDYPCLAGIIHTDIHATKRAARLYSDY